MKPLAVDVLIGFAGAILVLVLFLLASSASRFIYAGF